MATKQPAVGVDHPTVVPENYDAESEADAADDEGSSESDGRRRE